MHPLFQTKAKKLSLSAKAKDTVSSKTGLNVAIFRNYYIKYVMHEILTIGLHCVQYADSHIRHRTVQSIETR